MSSVFACQVEVPLGRGSITRSVVVTAPAAEIRSTGRHKPFSTSIPCLGARRLDVKLSAITTWRPTVDQEHPERDFQALRAF